MQIIDLTQEIFEGMSVFPMHQKTFLFKNITHEESLKKFGFMFSTNNLLINEHGPTHTDALYESSRKPRWTILSAAASAWMSAKSPTTALSPPTFCGRRNRTAA